VSKGRELCPSLDTFEDIVGMPGWAEVEERFRKG
jgi:hypothetical protein